MRSMWRGAKPLEIRLRRRLLAGGSITLIASS